MDISKKIKMMMLEKDITMTELSSLLNTSQPNLSAKFKRNDFRISELKSFAEILGYELKIEFIEK
ncbi:helix-turn-helix domain-containing protein [Clostridium paraputrificum]|jgi:hypothetical protein|uniref:helix-turn-helix domain-containing protein n=1 Tax=Clostridium paraputrificum TaxID=29363 RepID=UPI00204B1B51|nr:MAG TPA: Regulatory protein [Caudoviricetes sp.]